MIAKDSTILWSPATASSHFTKSHTNGDEFVKSVVENI